MEGLRNDRAKEVEDDAETERVIGLVMTAIEDDLRGVAKAIISKRDDELLGPGRKTPGDSGAPMSARTPRACVNKGPAARAWMGRWSTSP
jgi:hypothetical protein